MAHRGGLDHQAAIDGPVRPGGEVVFRDCSIGGEEHHHQSSPADAGVSGQLPDVPPRWTEDLGGVPAVRPLREILRNGLDLQPDGFVERHRIGGIKEGGHGVGGPKGPTLVGHHQIAAVALAPAPARAGGRVALLAMDAEPRLPKGVGEMRVKGHLVQDVEAVDRLLGPERQFSAAKSLGKGIGNLGKGGHRQRDNVG